MQISDTQPLDYLVIGHITQDLVKGGAMLGGTASYSTMTAHALGLHTGLVTSCPKWLRLPEIEPIKTYRKFSQHATTFENIETDHGRQQVVHHCAAIIGAEDIPETFLDAAIIHLGPVANEVNPLIIKDLPSTAFLGLTPQGWMRIWGNDGHVHYRPWQTPEALLERANAVVISLEDVQGDEDLIGEYAQKTRILVVTEGFNGARVYWNGDIRHVSAPKVNMIDQTGAGDIFAAVFFARLRATNDPWMAAEQAVKLASQSVTRTGLAGIPTPEEVRDASIEIVKGS
jgi:sugar/nucleoside kinase (ribokinase family)